MKSYGGLFDRICAFENLHAAYRKARRGKRSRPDVCRFTWRIEDELVRLQRALADGSYRPAGYRTFPIFEPKRRLISAAPFRDRIVHHALCNILEPLFERGFVFDSYASRKGKGTHRAVRRCQAFARRSPYFLKTDIVKFFPSVDHAILLDRIRRRIRDRRVLNLVARILDSGRGIFDTTTAYRWIDKRGFPAHKAGRLLRFKLSEVDEWVRKGGGREEPQKREE